MFERFTERARQSIVLAQQEAREMGFPYIGTEHILLGLIKEEEGLAAMVLERVGVKYDEVKKYSNGLAVESVEPTEPKGELPFTPRAKKVYELSLREALSLGHNYIGTEHILLGLIRENEGQAANILFKFLYALTPDQIRNEVVKMLSGPSGRNEQKRREREKLWTPAKTEEETLKEDGQHELVVRSVRDQVITICGDLTLEVGRDIYGRLNIQISNPSGLPLTISEK